jgi:hypothetical protein
VGIKGFVDEPAADEWNNTIGRKRIRFPERQFALDHQRSNDWRECQARPRRDDYRAIYAEAVETAVIMQLPISQGKKTNSGCDPDAETGCRQARVSLVLA